MQELSFSLEEANAEADSLRGKLRRVESRNNELEGDIEALQSELRTQTRGLGIIISNGGFQVR